MKNQAEITFPILDSDEVRRSIEAHADAWAQLLANHRVEAAAAP